MFFIMWGFIDFNHCMDEAKYMHRFSLSANMPPDSQQSLIPSENGSWGAEDGPPWICSLDSAKGLSSTCYI